MDLELQPYQVSIYRGGTSKGIYIKENELPKDIEMRKEVIRRIFGSPDTRQIDGLGGADVLTSKLAIIGPSTRPDCDIDYTFAQVSFDTDLVDFGGNCGNISAGVGPFAIDHGLVAAVEPVTTIRIHQVNTGCVLISRVPVCGGKAKVFGDCHIDGVPGTGAPIQLDFADTCGSTTGHLLPTGNPVDEIVTEAGRHYEVSIVDAGVVTVFVEARSLGMIGTESCAEIDKNAALSAEIEAIRSACAVKIGMAASCEEATKSSAYAPFFAIVSPPADYVCEANGKHVSAKDVDLVARLSFMLHMHKAYPGTGTTATGAAAHIPGTLVHRQLSKEARMHTKLRIGHPSGMIEVNVEPAAQAGAIGFSEICYTRTARRILEGTVYIRSFTGDTASK